MKKIISLLLVICLGIGISVASSNGPVIAFSKSTLTHDFGTVKLNAKAEYAFEFTNTGNKPLIIMDVQSTCGCTTPEYSKVPVAPKKTGTIKVGYKTDQTGIIDRSITVKTNAGEYQLKIKGEVVK